MTRAPKRLALNSLKTSLMFDRQMTVERLLAHSLIFDEAARAHPNGRVAGEFRRLAEGCVQAALTMINEATSQYRFNIRDQSSHV